MPRVEEAFEPSLKEVTQAPPAFMIVHISDLHFGGELYPAWTWTGAPLAPPPWRGILALQGLFPHDPGACRELQVVIKGLVDAKRPRRVLVAVTGDLTALGYDSEFVLALTFLRSRLQSSWNSGLGLGSYDLDVLAVPGNHDHARGSILSHVAQLAAPLCGLYFREEPEWCVPYEDHSLRLDVLGIDSCGAPGTQWFAKGRTDPRSLDRLAAVLASTGGGRNPLRILLCHHPPSAGGRHVDQESAKAVLNFCKQQRIHFVLCGHTHDPLVPRPGTPHTFGMELRCGTTLQGALPGRLPSRSGQTFLVHWVWPSGTDVLWRTEPFQRLVRPRAGRHAARGPFVLAEQLVFETRLSL